MMQIHSAALSSTTIVPLLLVVVILVCLYIVPRNSRYDQPPGPRGLPFFGNTFQISLNHFGTYLKALHARHGGLVYLNINREHVFSIGDLELATELLERRSGIYSSRPTIPFVERYLDPEGKVMWPLAKPGEVHFWGRRLSVSVMKHVRNGHSEPLQRLEAMALLQNIVVSKGEEWYEQTNQMAARTMVAAMFGVSSVNGEAPEVAKTLKLVDSLTLVADPFATIINILPFIDDLIPASIPTPWRKLGKAWAKHDSEGWQSLFQEALEGKGAGLSTWATMFADEGKDRKELLNAFAGAAIGTTSSALHNFVLACVAFPKWVESAQQELDTVVGSDRLPVFQDRPSLPFVDAVVREIFRWNPPVRAGLPHVNTADDVVKYKGKEYLIPKGSTIYCPPFVMEHDPKRYDSPEVFDPQRHLDEKGRLKGDYRTSSFGFGRRMCIGIPFAERSVWIVVATVLWKFNIRKTVNPKTGSPFEYKLTDEAFDGNSIANGPLTFPVDFEPRDGNRIAVARREWEDTEKDLSVLLPPLKR